MAGTARPTGGTVGGDEGQGGEAPLCKVQKGATRWGFYEGWDWGGLWIDYRLWYWG